MGGNRLTNAIKKSVRGVGVSSGVVRDRNDKRAARYCGFKGSVTPNEDG